MKPLYSLENCSDNHHPQGLVSAISALEYIVCGIQARKIKTQQKRHMHEACASISLLPTSYSIPGILFLKFFIAVEPSIAE